jgi:hypothetical protein
MPLPYRAIISSYIASMPLFYRAIVSYSLAPMPLVLPCYDSLSHITSMSLRFHSTIRSIEHEQASIRDLPALTPQLSCAMPALDRRYEDQNTTTLLVAGTFVKSTPRA